VAKSEAEQFEHDFPAADRSVSATWFRCVNAAVPAASRHGTNMGCHDRRLLILRLKDASALAVVLL